MYRFQISAHTQVGESIGLIGSTKQLGLWDVTKCLHLKTSRQHYPLWWIEIELEPNDEGIIQYKYLKLSADGSVEWESLGINRWVPRESYSQPIIIEDGSYGHLQPFPYGYFPNPTPRQPLPKESQGLKILVIGSSVALGCNAWLLKGWAYHLEQILNQKYGHQLVNRSELGANVSGTIERFPLVFAAEQPDIVIIALSLGNEGLAYCPPYQRRAVQRRFESGLQQLVKMTQEMGAMPILGGVYPHGDYQPEHTWLVRDTHNRMLTWGIPILNWFPVLDDGQGRWQNGISFDVAHPTLEGHRLMYEAIDLSFFQIDKSQLEQLKQQARHKREISVFRDEWGFHVFTCPEEKSLRIINTSKNSYTIAAYWQELQTALITHKALTPGIYIAKNTPQGTLPFFWVCEDGSIETMFEIPPYADVEYEASFKLFSPKASQILFYDGHLGILKESSTVLRLINETEHEYNIQPMWKEVRVALKEMPSGVYEDSLAKDTPFRTMMIGEDGLESRVKIPPKSALLFQYKCQLSEISRIALLPLGDRCAARMLLYKMEYDGPAFPFDLTRSTNLADVADIIANDFNDMWNPHFLYYSPEGNRLYHTKWTGLSFGHEVEDTDDPLRDMSPIYERMHIRYSARSERFHYALNKCDEVLFIRTGFAERGTVIDLLDKLKGKCNGKPFRVLLLSGQSSEEFAGLANVIHHQYDFSPDQMYADLDYWLHCTDIMRSILESLGVSSKNLFWCPPNPPKTSLVC